jgi:hypothetical protein
MRRVAWTTCCPGPPGGLGSARLLSGRRSRKWSGAGSQADTSCCFAAQDAFSDTTGVVRPSGSPFFPLARVGPTTPKRARARASRRPPPGSVSKLADVRQPRTTVVNPTWGFLARSKRRTRSMPAWLFAGTRPRRRGLAHQVGKGPRKEPLVGGARLTLETGSGFPIGVRS